MNCENRGSVRCVKYCRKRRTYSFLFHGGTSRACNVGMLVPINKYLAPTLHHDELIAECFRLNSFQFSRHVAFSCLRRIYFRRTFRKMTCMGSRRKKHDYLPEPAAGSGLPRDVSAKKSCPAPVDLHTAVKWWLTLWMISRGVSCFNVGTWHV